MNHIKILIGATVLSIFIVFPLTIGGQTAIQKTENNWQLLVDGKPFDIKGVTFGYDKNIANYDTYFKDLNFLGV